MNDGFIPAIKDGITFEYDPEATLKIEDIALATGDAPKNRAKYQYVDSDLEVHESDTPVSATTTLTKENHNK